jgi:hypothetical protein
MGGQGLCSWFWLPQSAGNRERETGFFQEQKIMPLWRYRQVCAIYPDVRRLRYEGDLAGLSPTAVNRIPSF